MRNAKCLLQFQSVILDNHTDYLLRSFDVDTQNRDHLAKSRRRRSHARQLTISGEDANTSQEQIVRRSRNSPVSVDKFGISSVPGGSITATSADDSTINTRVRTISGSSGSDEQSYTMTDDDGVKIISDGNDFIIDWPVNRSASAPTREGHGGESTETGEENAETAEQSAVAPTGCLLI